MLVDCLGIARDEQLVVLTDPPQRDIAGALVQSGRSLGAEGVLIEMDVRETHGSEPPRAVAAALLEADVVVAPTTKSVTHTEARRAASDRGARIATMASVTEDMLIRTMTADLAALRARSRAVADALTGGAHVHIWSARGTDISFSIDGRHAIADDGDLRTPGRFGNLPAGEGFIAPVEGTAAGTIVFEGSLAPVGKIDEPVTVEVDDGFIVDAAGERAEEFLSQLRSHGRAALAVAELGIGTNERARIGGEILEDEKVLGTVHVAFGANSSFGGAIQVASHQDGLVLEPTVEIDGRRILDNGTLLL